MVALEISTVPGASKPPNTSFCNSYVATDGPKNAISLIFLPFPLFLNPNGTTAKRRPAVIFWHQNNTRDGPCLKRLIGLDLTQPYHARERRQIRPIPAVVALDCRAGQGERSSIPARRFSILTNQPPRQQTAAESNHLAIFIYLKLPHRRHKGTVLFGLTWFLDTTEIPVYSLDTGLACSSLRPN